MSMPKARTMLDKITAIAILIKAMKTAGYYMYSSHYHVGTDRASGYYELPEESFRKALRDGRLKGVKENGRWKIHTHDLCNFILLYTIDAELTRRQCGDKVKVLIDKELKKMGLNRF